MQCMECNLFISINKLVTIYPVAILFDVKDDDYNKYTIKIATSDHDYCDEDKWLYLLCFGYYHFIMQDTYC